MPQGSGPIALFRFIDYSESDDILNIMILKVSQQVLAEQSVQGYKQWAL